ncbi:Leucine-rich repeat and coiled-coil domain-containing protein 1 [Fasciola hepatica]|uniref:Leucine-rich repeat and coiled-coil domain-containing protein 1 n=1 Tax=Fasciola hepatica TaxID=6192 RepID=A0A4E0RZI3_FASHE|nr:Leucine-rich repeat and coiled-coil domain-containing protein 1 [Fasciola hepatica]
MHYPYATFLCFICSSYNLPPVSSMHDALFDVSAMSSRWHDRATLLDKLEKQVEQMRRGWDKEQQLLIAERDEAKAHSAALQEQMERMDSSFRKQLSATIEANDRAISAARSDAEMIRSNCENRVAEVEAEMRVVLEETEEARRAMEARLRKISTVLYDPSSTDCTSTPDRPVLHGYYPHTCPHVNEWRTTPPPPPPPMPHPTISSGFSSSVPVGPPVHSCSRATRPNSPFEQEIGPVCESGTCCSPH